MPVWVYRARDTVGQMVSGRIDAETERDLISRLRSQGFMVLGIERDRDLQHTMKHYQGSFFSRKIRGAELAIFARQFATMINAALPVVMALKVLARQSANPRLQKALTQIATDVEAGETLSEAFTRQGDSFPPIMIQMIGAGEVGGILDDTLTRLAIHLEKEEAILRKVRAAMVYPMMVSGAAVLVVTFLMIFVVPTFQSIYSDMGSDLPAMTQLLIQISEMVKGFWWLIPLLVLASGMGIRYWRRTEQGSLGWDQMLLKLPVFGPMVVKQSIARFARTLSGLLASGITILKALSVVERTVGNRVVADVVREGSEEVRQGQNLGSALRRSTVFPPMVLEMINIGEESGTLEEMLGKVADFYEEDVQRTAEKLAASLEPLIIVFLALVVGGIVVALMLPVFNLSTLI